jgi:uncharacterized SAM-dependent methyltransferase
MRYFKNNELAETYHVTIRTVLNWIQASKDGKLDLVLHDENGKSYVSNTAENVVKITRLAEERRKYRNLKTVKTVEPKPEFYILFSEDQICDIISNLEIHHEIPRQYNYFDGGAGHWDRYAERLANEEAPNFVNTTVDLLDMMQSYIDGLLKGRKRVNVVDVGVGNAYPVRNFLAHLLEQKQLGRYIALDISPDMLKIAESNIHSWFGDKVDFEGYEYDISYDRFSKLLASEYLRKDAKDTVNLVLLLGGTLSNMRHSDGGYRIIHDSMGVNDYLIHTTKLDTETARSYFDFNFEPGNTSLSPNHRLIFDLLNIDESLYEVEMGYDDSVRQRYIRIRLKKALNIKFTFKGGEREVRFNKGEIILLWRFLQQTVDHVKEQFDRNDLFLVNTSLSRDKEYMLTVSQVKSE